MDFIETVLAFVGVIALIAVFGVAFAFWLLQPIDPEPEADPYQDGLDATARITAAAWEAAQALRDTRRIEG